MNITKLVLIAGALVILTVVLLVLSLRDSGQAGPEVGIAVPPETVPPVSTSNPRNLTYVIAGEAVTLENGQAEIATAPGSATKTVTQYFGNELTLDVNGDGQEDTVFLLTQDGGGTGTFFYLAAALKTAQGYEGSEAVFIGDRIAPQSTVRGSVPGTVVVNYADRAPGESFATPPSVGRSLVLKFDSDTRQFGEVVQDFEGEAFPDMMTLTMKTWQWVEASFNDGRTETPLRPDTFTLTFTEDNSFSITTDCNSGGGTYAREEDQLTFSEMRTTLMYCEGSQETLFQQLLANTSAFHFTSNGQLILHQKYDSGSVVFR